MQKPPGLTYRDAGVDIDAGDELVERIKPLVRRTQRPEVLAGIGGFGALVGAAGRAIASPMLVSGTDGVGTKLRLAIDTGRHDTHRHRSGGDVRQRRGRTGRRAAVLPRLLRHRQARRRASRSRSSRGIAEGCVQAGCALVGGETAEMPGMYHGGDYDLAGFCVGVVEKERIIDGSKVARRRRGDRPGLLRARTPTATR